MSERTDRNEAACVLYHRHVRRMLRWLDLYWQNYEEDNAGDLWTRYEKYRHLVDKANDEFCESCGGPCRDETAV